MRRGGPLERRTPLRSVGKKGRADRRELDAVRTELLFRSRGRCEARGFSDLCTGYGVEVHHVVKRSLGGKHTPENCVLICEFCHAKTETDPAEALAAGWLRPSWSMGDDAA